MSASEDQTLGDYFDQIGKAIQSTRGPKCVHEICPLVGKDPNKYGAVLVLLSLVHRMSGSRLGAPAKIGGAGVGLKAAGLFAKSPSDYFFWSLSDGAKPTPDGLATFGPEWQGAALADKVRAHSQTYQPLYGTRGRGPPVPDIVL